MKRQKKKRRKKAKHLSQFHGALTCASISPPLYPEKAKKKRAELDLRKLHAGKKKEKKTDK